MQSMQTENFFENALVRIREVVCGGSVETMRTDSRSFESMTSSIKNFQ